MSISHFKRIAAFGFSVNHFHNLFINSFSSRVSLSPIIPRSAAIFRNKNVLWIVQVRIRRYKDVIDNLTMMIIEVSLERQFTHPWFQINKDCAGNIVFIVCLIKEDVLTVTTFSCPLLKNAIFANSMFCAQTLPKDGAHWIRRSDCIPYNVASRLYFDYHIVQAGLLLFREAWRGSVLNVCHTFTGQCHTDNIATNLILRVKNKW